MINTHYEADHLPGLTSLLKRSLPRYANTVIYDRGWPGGALDNMYIRYLRAIDGFNDNGPIPALAYVNRTRVTNTVQADGIPPTMQGSVAALPNTPVGGVAAINDGEDWLLTGAAPAEILWNGVPGGAPAGAPTLSCIAVNRYVRTAAGGIIGPVGGMGLATNAMSLAFELRFNNFRYYIGGDIETAQENQIQLLLNPNDNAVGRVTAMKASHHGGNTATSRDFVDRMRPEAIFISCGTMNTYPHPATETINVLDGYLAAPVLHAPPPPEPACRPVRNYLTGYAVVGPPSVAYGGRLTITSGDPTVHPVVRGTIRVTVTQAQSNVPPQGRPYHAVREVVRQVATNANLAGAATVANANTAADFAAEVALPYGVGDTAGAVITGFNLPAAMMTATENAAAGVYDSTPTIVAPTVTNAAIAAGVPPAIAAAAGAAAGSRRGLGQQISVENAVRTALVAAGRPLANAAAEATTAGNAVVAASPAAGQFTVTIYRQAIGQDADYLHM